MATTWAGTADNQLITRSALQDGVTNGYFALKSGASITGTTQICTKSYIDSVIDNIYGLRTWANYTSSQCPPKSGLALSTKRQFRVYASAPSGYTYTLVVKSKDYYSGAFTTISTNTISSTTCSNLYLSAGLTALDQIYFYFSTSLYANVRGYVNKNSSTCGQSGTNGCPPIIFTVLQNDKLTIDYACQVQAPIVDCGV